MGIGKSFKKAVGKVSKAVGGNAYGSVLKADAEKKEAKAKEAQAQKVAQHEREAKALASEIELKRKNSNKTQNSLISQETIQNFLRGVIG